MTTRTYVVTGAGSGIGQVVARLVQERGHRVVGVDLKGADVTADLSTPEGRAEAVQEVLEAAGGSVDAVVACAGVSFGSPKTVSINYFGVTDFVAPLLPALAASEAPRVAVVSSITSQSRAMVPEVVDAALAGDEDAAVRLSQKVLEESPEKENWLYPTSKRALSRWVRRESVTPQWAGEGIPLNAVAPGVVLTPMTAPLLEDEAMKAVVAESTPMPLNGYQSPESVAELLLWLTSPENTHTTGQTIYCDGGADVVLRGDDVWAWNDTIRD